MAADLDNTASPSAFGPARKPRKLAQTLAEALVREIQSGALKPGDKLPTESAIMAAHGVSRTVVREALSQLQASALVETRHGIGTFVLAPSASGIGGIAADTIRDVRDLLAVLELRISLETEAAWLAAQRRSEEQLAQLAETLGAMHRSHAQQEGRAASVEADVRFHLLIAQATGNPYFVEILSHLGNAIIPRARVNTTHLTADQPAAYLERVNREHEDIFQAILRRDAEAARAAMRTHLSNSRERLRRAQEAFEASRA